LNIQKCVVLVFVKNCSIEYQEHKGLSQAFYRYAEALIAQKEQGQEYIASLSEPMREKYDKYQEIMQARFGQRDTYLQHGRSKFDDEPLASAIADDVADMNHWAHTPAGFVGLMIEEVENDINYRSGTHSVQMLPHSQNGEVRNDVYRAVVDVKELTSEGSKVVMKVECLYNHELGTAEPIAIAREPDMKRLTVEKGEVTTDEISQAFHESCKGAFLDRADPLFSAIERRALTCEAQLPDGYRVHVTSEGAFQLDSPDSREITIGDAITTYDLKAVTNAAQQDHKLLQEEERFLSSVDALLTKAYGIGINDTDDVQAREVFREQGIPESFVHAWAEKYELTPVNEREAGRIRTVAETIESKAAVAPEGRTYLTVPFKEKEEAKGLGARWDRQARSWYVPEGQDIKPFTRWMGNETSQEQAKAKAETVRESSQDKVFLAVPFKEKGKAKELGARWDRGAKSWYVPAGQDIKPFAQWLPEQQETQQLPAKDPQSEFHDVLTAAGFQLKGLPEMDGKIHRVSMEDDRKGERSGVYCGYMDGRPAGWYENHREKIRHKWVSNGQQLSEEERAAMKAQAAQKKVEREAERERKYAHHAHRCRQLVELLPDANNDHPYLQKKGIEAFPGLKVDKHNRLVLPLYNQEGEICSVQRIAANGQKRLKKLARKMGLFGVVDPDNQLKGSSNPLVIGEGVATAATLHMATNSPAIIAIDSGNLPSVAETLRALNPDRQLIIGADDDHPLESKGKDNIGMQKAREAAEVSNAVLAAPSFTPEEKAKGLTDFNDIQVSRGLNAVARQVNTAVMLNEERKQKAQSKERENRQQQAREMRNEREDRGIAIA